MRLCVQSSKRLQLGRERRPHSDHFCSAKWGWGKWGDQISWCRACVPPKSEPGTWYRDIRRCPHHPPFLPVHRGTCCRGDHLGMRRWQLLPGCCVDARSNGRLFGESTRSALAELSSTFLLGTPPHSLVYLS